MLITPERDRKQRLLALAASCLVAAVILIAGWQYRPLLVLLVLCPLLYWTLRRRYRRRLATLQRPFPPAWEDILRSQVAYFNALDEAGRVRFRQLVAIFLDEVKITGIRTSIDDTVRLLVAASAVIPVFGFSDWEYRRLGEVLVYPEAFNDEFQTHGAGGRNLLGMVGLNHLRGVMVLSKPSLLAGFTDPSTPDNVGIHEFAHLVELEEIERGLPPEVPREVVRHWVRYVAHELANPQQSGMRINDYAYKNEHEFYAVLAEYFFKSPDFLKQQNPGLYKLLRDMFHQDTSSLLAFVPKPDRGFGSN